MSPLAWIKAALGGGLLVAVLAGVWYYGHTRYQAGAASKQAEVETMRSHLEGAYAALIGVDASTRKAQAKAKAAKARAAQAVRSAAASAHKAQAMNQAWQRKLQAAKADPSCAAVLEMKICPRLANY